MDCGCGLSADGTWPALLQMALPMMALCQTGALPYYHVAGYDKPRHGILVLAEVLGTAAVANA